MTRNPETRLARPPVASRHEEWANCGSHALGLLLAVAALPVLAGHALRAGDAMAVVGATVFGVSAILLYLASTLYHAITQPRLKVIFRLLDHGAIYLLIAGTYTPITLGVLRGGWGWGLLGAIWALALAGVLFKTLAGTRFPKLSTFLYLAMGWLALVAIVPLWQRMDAAGLAWLFAGGLAYSFGVIFYVLDGRLRYSHLVWHLFVLAGTACHFVVVLHYAI